MRLWKITPAMWRRNDRAIAKKFHTAQCHAVSLREEQNFKLAKRRYLPRLNRFLIAVNQQRPDACGCRSGDIFLAAVTDGPNVFGRDAKLFGRVLEYHR